jgi:hypothetical protein
MIGISLQDAFFPAAGWACDDAAETQTKAAPIRQPTSDRIGLL